MIETGTATARSGVANSWGRLLARAALVWLVILLAAFVNGAFRAMVLGPVLGGPRAELASALILIGILLFGADWLVRRTRPRRPLWQWLLVGLFWAVLTVGFEFLFFHFVVGMPWPELLAAYDVTQGRYFGVVALATLLAPPLMARLRRR